MRIPIAIAFSCCTLFIYPSAWAQNIPTEWVSCETSADCDVVSSPCGASFGINVHYIEEVHKEICKTEDCSGSCDGSAIHAYAAICQNGKCAPDYNAKPTPAQNPQFELKDLDLRCQEKNPNCGVQHR